MILFPAIDIIEGKVVRLKQGDYDQVTRYSEDPVAQARAWADQGATWLHVVDLDAAKLGQPANLVVIAEIARHSGLKVQLGGGIRTLDMAQTYFNEGVSRIIVGTKAVEQPEFLKMLGKTFPGKVGLGLDTREGKIATHGWTETLEVPVEDFLKTAPLEGIYCIVSTDIARDGMLEGPNIDALKKVMAATDLPVIASGGISSLEDIRKLNELEDCKLLGAIVGKALYEGKFTLQEALKVARG